MKRKKHYLKESDYQHDLKNRIEERFPGSIVMKNDPSFIQGIPDLTIIFNNHWACLEAKIDPNASHQPNQDYYIDEMNRMSFASFINPENEEDVLDAMEQSFKI